MKLFSDFMTEARLHSLMRRAGDNLIAQKNMSGRPTVLPKGGFGKHEKVNVGGKLGSSNPTHYVKAFGGLKKLMRDRVEAKDAVKHLSKHVDHKPMFDEINAIASDKPNSDVRNVIKHHLRKAGMKNTHLL